MRKNLNLVFLSLKLFVFRKLYLEDIFHISFKMSMKCCKPNILNRVRNAIKIYTKLDKYYRKLKSL